MRLSQKSIPFNYQNKRKPLKQPKQLITRLNDQLSTLQSAIEQYNQSEQKSLQWKKDLNMGTNSCQLKALTQPKLQNILLESNFIGSIQMFGKANESAIMKSSVLKKKNSTNNNNSKYNPGLRKTMSIMRDNVDSRSTFLGPNKLSKQRSQQNEHKRTSSNRIQPAAQNNSKGPNGQHRGSNNPQVSAYNIECQQQSVGRFHSFRQEVGKYDKLALISKAYKQNYSNKRANSQHAQLAVSHLSSSIILTKNNNNSNNHESNFLFPADDTTTLIGGEDSQSVLMMGNAYGRNSKELELLPVTEEKLFSHIHANTNTINIRRRIEEKTTILQKEWLKTQNYRQRFNIQTPIPPPPHNRTRRSSTKLSNIIQKIEQRRPSTSVSCKRQGGFVRRENTNETEGW